MIDKREREIRNKYALTTIFLLVFKDEKCQCGAIMEGGNKRRRAI